VIKVVTEEFKRMAVRGRNEAEKGVGCVLRATRRCRHSNETTGDVVRNVER